MANHKFPSLTMLTVLLLSLALSWHSEAANIIISAFYGEGSHFLAGAAIGRGLVKRGHYVTFLIGAAYSHHAQEPMYSNFSFEIFQHTVPVEEVRELFNSVNKIAFGGMQAEFAGLASLLANQTAADCGAVISDKRFMKRMEQMDAMVMDISLPCGIYIKTLMERNRIRPKMIAFSPTTPWEGFLKASGSTFNHAYQPEITSGLSNKMNFKDRVTNLASSIF